MGWESGTKREFKFDPNSTENEGRWRLYSPGLIAKDSYFRRKSSTAGVGYVMGKANGGPAKGKSVIQAVRFDKDKFTEAEASKWWSKNHGRENLVFSDERKKEAMNRMTVAKELLVIAKELAAAGETADEAHDIVEDIFDKYGRPGSGWGNLEGALRGLTVNHPDILKEDFHFDLWMKKKHLENQMKAVETGLRWAQ